MVAIRDPPLLRIQTLLLSCEKKLISELIGPGGRTISRLQEETGARINIDKSVNPCLITISATDNMAIEQCRVLVEEILNPPTTTICCDPRLAGDVIGQGGSTIRHVQGQTGARVDVESNRDALVCTVTITGTSEAMAAAKTMIDAIVNPPKACIECDQRRISDVIGPVRQCVLLPTLYYTSDVIGPVRQCVLPILYYTLYCARLFSYVVCF